MKLSICHYSYHRTWEKQKWSCTDLARAVKAQGVGAVDFHARFVGEPNTATQRIKDALSESGLEISGISLSNNLFQEDEKFEEEIEETTRWIRIAAEVAAPVSRIFGGSIHDRSNQTHLEAGIGRIIDGLGRLAIEAKKYGMILGLENHGGLPCTAEEQIDVIRKINSAHLRATVDIGNYMSCGQDSVESCRISAPYAAYVHVKDFAKKKSAVNPWGWEIEPSVLGTGVVDVPGCLAVLAEAGFTGHVALEYEAKADEESAVTESIEYFNRVKLK